MERRNGRMKNEHCTVYERTEGEPKLNSKSSQRLLVQWLRRLHPRWLSGSTLDSSTSQSTSQQLHTWLFASTMCSSLPSLTRRLALLQLSSSSRRQLAE